MIENLRIKIPEVMLGDRSDPFVFTDSAERFKDHIHEWLINHSDEVYAEDDGYEFRYLVFDNDNIALLFWLAFGEEFLEAKGEEDRHRKERAERDARFPIPKIVPKIVGWSYTISADGNFTTMNDGDGV